MKTVGVIGGGQLARMMIPAAINLGIDLKVFAEAEGSPAALATTHVGNYLNTHEVKDFARDVDVITFDHEHVPTQVLEEARKTGTLIAPSPEALTLTHNKIVMRQSLAKMGVPQPLWGVVEDVDSREEAISRVGGFPCVAKKPVGGYDGKGVRIINSWGEIEDWLAEGAVLIEEKVPFTRELALLSARRQGGEWVPWLPVETRQVAGVCSEVIAPAPRMSEGMVREAGELSQKISVALEIVGVLAVEVFQLDDDSLIVNELAMRPHNSGHVFTELSVTSQFEQHLRAVADLPLGSTAFTSNAGVMVNLLGGIDSGARDRVWEAVPDAKIHDYGKAPRPGRKVGHIVVVGSDAEKALARADHARSLLTPRG